MYGGGRGEIARSSHTCVHALIGDSLMRMAVLSGSLLLVGLTVTGCRESVPQGKIDPNLPVVSVKIRGMT
jgi:hypothetical protein